MHMKKLGIGLLVLIVLHSVLQPNNIKAAELTEVDYAINDMIDGYKEACNNNLAYAFDLICMYSEYYEDIYIELPDKPDLLGDVIDLLKDTAIEQFNLPSFNPKDIVLEITETVFGTSIIEDTIDVIANIQEFSGLFSLEEPTYLMAYLAADISVYSTILREIAKTGEVTDESFYIALTAFGQFLQRYAAIDDIYNSGKVQRYQDDYKSMIYAYSQYKGFKTMIGMLEQLKAAPESGSCDIEATIDKIVKETSSYMYFDAYTLKLNYDSPKLAKIERTNKLTSYISPYFFSGLLKVLMDVGMEQTSQTSESAIYAELVKMNAFASKTLNPSLEALNEVSFLITEINNFFEHLPLNNDKPNYHSIYKKLSNMAADDIYKIFAINESIDGFNALSYDTIMKLNTVVDLYDLILMESESKRETLTDFSMMFETFVVYAKRYTWSDDDYKEYMDKTIDILIECSNLRKNFTNIYLDQFTGYKDPEIDSASYYEFYGSNYAGTFMVNIVSTSRSRSDKCYLLLRECQANYSYDQPIWEIEYLNYYDRNGKLYLIEEPLTGNYAYFDYFGALLKASDDEGWIKRIEKNQEVSNWLYNNIRSCTADDFIRMNNSR